MQTVKVSIITATYNRSEVLAHAIESVLLQTFRDWELIIIGDACTDNTEEVVASFKDQRIRFVNRETSFGEQSGPNNDGFLLARGGLIAYLNHDDLWFPDHLERLVTFLEESKADLVYSLPLSVDRNNLFFCGLTNEELCYSPLHFVPASLWLLRRELLEALGGWRSAYSIHIRNPSQDVLFRAWKRSKILLCYPQFTVVIFPSASQPNSYRIRSDHQHKEMLKKMLDHPFREQVATTIARQSVERLYWWVHLSWGQRLRYMFDRICIRLALCPDAVRNKLCRRKKGWWITYLRQFRGL